MFEGLLCSKDFGQAIDRRGDLPVTSADESAGIVPFSVTVTRPEHAPVLIAVEGEIDLTTSEELRAAFDEALDPVPGSLVVDLRKVDFCDSTGLAALVHINRRCTTEDVALGFLPSATIARLALKTGLSTLLPFTDA
jgi:anti-sigma B factor antagonist